jgi:hypothetical protein
MRLLLILAAVVAAGLVLTLFALQRPAQPELAAVGAPQQAAPDALSQEPAPQATVQEETATPVPQAPAPAVPQTAAYNATLEACLALEKSLLSDLEDAEERLKDADDTYADAEENYDDALSSKFQDEAYLQQLRDERSEAREQQDAAESTYNLVLKRLSKTRQECGLFR